MEQCALSERDYRIYSDIDQEIILGGSAFNIKEIVNSGGRVQREYATGLGRIDLCVHFGEADNIQRYAEKSHGRGQEPTGDLSSLSHPKIR